MGASIWAKGKARGRVLGRPKVVAPSPFRWPRDDCVGICGSNRAAVSNRALQQFIITMRFGVNVTMRGAPQVRLIVQNVGVHWSSSLVGVLDYHLNPFPNEFRWCRDAGPEWIPGSDWPCA